MPAFSEPKKRSQSETKLSAQTVLLNRAWRALPRPRQRRVFKIGGRKRHPWLSALSNQVSTPEALVIQSQAARLKDVSPPTKGAPRNTFSLQLNVPDLNLNQVSADLRPHSQTNFPGRCGDFRGSGRRTRPARRPREMCTHGAAARRSRA